MTATLEIPPPVRQGRHLVLVADDDPDVLALVDFRLRRSGYDVHTAADGTSALNLARSLRPSLVVLAVMMPGMTGMDVLRAMRADPATSGIPVILLTARAQETDVSQGFDAGADDYVRKPFSPQELSARVQSIIGRA